jgi:hypothetical protein
MIKNNKSTNNNWYICAFYLSNILVFSVFFLISISLLPLSIYNKYKLWHLGTLDQELIMRVILNSVFILSTLLITGTLHMCSRKSIKQILKGMRWMSWLLSPLLLSLSLAFLSILYQHSWCYFLGKP